MFDISHAQVLNTLINKNPGIIVGPIAAILGWIVNIIFNFVYFLGPVNSLGITIILFTIVTRLLMLPLSFKQQKSMYSMQAIQPEVNKIRNKYKDNKDPEVQKKMNMEIQKLYSTHGVNPLSGCLPLIIQMPIFFALSYVMENTYKYVSVINDIYTNISNILINYMSSAPDFWNNTLSQYIYPHLPSGMTLDFSVSDNMVKAINSFSAADWTGVMNALPPDVVNQIQPLLDQIHSINTFLVFNLTRTCNVGLPEVIVPILVGLATLLSSWVATKQSSASADPSAKTTSRVMLIVMPIMMGVMTFPFPAGVGLYWITSSLFSAIQTVSLNSYYKHHPSKKIKEAKK